MAHRPKLVVLLGMFSGSVFAGYALPSPPTNWQAVIQSVGGTPGQFGVRVAANDAVAAGVVRSTVGAVVNVGGRSVVMPVAYRVAANAGLVAARASYGNPALFLGVLAASALYQYYQGEGLSTDGAKWYKKIDGIECLSSCFEYQTASASWERSYTSAANSFASQPWIGNVCVATPDGTFTYNSRYEVDNHLPLNCSNSTQMNKRSIPPYTTSSSREATEFDFPMWPNVPLPDPVIKKWPLEFPPLPVEQPIQNPSPDSLPSSRPLRVPQGEPQRVPNSDPAQWRNPVLDIVPSPTATQPWRVDLQPKDIVKEDPSPLPVEPVPSEPKPGEEEQEKQPDLCEKNPDILACQKPEFGTVEPETVADKERALVINKDSGWGPENGTCPAPKTAQVLGITLSMPFTMLCDFALGIRPLLIAFAWLSAIGGFIGIGRKE